MILILTIGFLSRDGFSEVFGNGVVDLWAGGTRNILVGLVLFTPILLYYSLSVPMRYHLQVDLSKAVSQLHERFPLLQKTLANIIYKRSTQLRHEDYILAKWDSIDLLGILPSVDHRRKIVIVPSMARLSMDIGQLDFWITRALQDPHCRRNYDMAVGFGVLIAGGVTLMMGYRTASIILHVVFLAIVFLWIGGRWGIETVRNTRADLAASAVTGDPESAKRAINRLFGSGKTGAIETPKRILAIDAKYPPAVAVEEAVEAVPQPCDGDMNSSTDYTDGPD
ncbi:MAG: hypothetical protein ACYC1M_09775 [Armatimonadota bacterium]